jgi:succinoglycan biosynthesis transport protein ExoP
MNERHQAGGGDAPLTLRDYLSVLRRRKWVILLCVVVVTGVALAYSLIQNPVYEASSKVLLSRQNLASRLTGVPESSASTENEVFVNTQATVARVPAIAKGVIEKLGLTDVTPEQFLSESSVSSSPESEILTFKVANGDPELAAREATAYAHQYSKYRQKQDTASLDVAQEGVEAKIQRLKDAGEEGTAFYNSLLNREQQLQTIATLQTANTTVVEASTEAPKVSPKTSRNVVLGFVVGLVVGIGLAFLIEALDTRIRSAEELEDRLGMRLIGRVPALPKTTGPGHQPMLTEPMSPNAEAYRILRTNLDFLTLDQPCRSILITSALEQEGKTTTAANLAVACAQAGKRVALVDLDLRKPRVHALLDVPFNPGLADVLRGVVPLDEALTAVSVEPSGGGDGGSDLGMAQGSLEVLTSGSVPPNPGDLASSGRLSTLLAEISEKVDLVVIDSPPMLHVGDAASLSSNVDAVVIVARMQRLRRANVSEIHRMLGTMRVLKLGFVLTGVERGEAYGYGGYGYGSQNGDGQGVGSGQVGQSSPNL